MESRVLQLRKLYVYFHKVDGEVQHMYLEDRGRPGQRQFLTVYHHVCSVVWSYCRVTRFHGTDNTLKTSLHYCGTTGSAG